MPPSPHRRLRAPPGSPGTLPLRRDSSPTAAAPSPPTSGSFEEGLYGGEDSDEKGEEDELGGSAVPGEEQEEEEEEGDEKATFPKRGYSLLLDQSQPEHWARYVPPGAL